MVASGNLTAPCARGPFLTLLAANAVSVVGNQFTALSVPWFVLQTTGSVAKTGIAGAVTALSFLASFFGGGLVDRLGFKRASVIADLASGVTVALVPLLYRTVGLSFWQVLLLIFARAACDTPGGTARSGMLPDLIALGDIGKERANGLYQSSQQGARIASTMLAGLLIAVVGASNMLWLDACSFGISATLIVFFVPVARRTATVPGLRGAYWSGLGEGLRFLRADRILWAITITAPLVNLALAALSAVILPVYAARVYRTAPSLGFLFTGIGAGGLAGALLYTACGARLPRRGTLLAGVAMLCPTFGLLALEPPLAFAAAILAVGAFFVGPLTVLSAVIAQERVPAALRGRVFGARGAIMMISTPIGALLGGYLVAGVGLRLALIWATGLLLAVSAQLFANRALRGLTAAVGTTLVPAR